MAFDPISCAKNCVGADTLRLYQAQFDACGHDLDLLFSVDTGDEDFYRKVLTPGKLYETGYPRCICWRSEEDEIPCECSRQALIYLYSQLLPERRITVTPIQTVRKGGASCVFHIEVE